MASEKVLRVSPSEFLELKALALKCSEGGEFNEAAWCAGVGAIAPEVKLFESYRVEVQWGKSNG